MEEVVDLLSCSLTHDGLQFGGGGVAELLDAGEVLQQGQRFDLADPGDLLDQSQDQRVQQLERTPPPEGVLPALPVDLETMRAGWKISIRQQNVLLRDVQVQFYLFDLFDLTFI